MTADEIFLTPKELVARWRLKNTSVLDRWRHQGGGPVFTKIGHRTVIYALSDVVKFEDERKRRNTVDSGKR